MSGRDRPRTKARAVPRLGELDWPHIVLYALALAVVVTLTIVASTSTTAFGPYNPGWDGTTDLRETAESDPDVDSQSISDTREYETIDPDGTVVFVVAPKESYDERDAERIAEFVDDGGTLVVLEDFDGAGNALLADVGATARVDGRLLRDERAHDRGPAMPVATGVENHTLTTDVDRLTLNHGTAIEPGNATVLATTSNYSYLSSGPESFRGQSRLGPHPVATVEAVGSGRVIVVGDPSIAINVMREKSDNSAFLRGIWSRDDTERVVFDASHTGELPPLAAGLLFVRDSALVQFLLGAIGVAGIAIGAKTPVMSAINRAVERRDDSGGELAGFGEQECAEYLRRRHPELDEAQIARIVTALNYQEIENADTE